jgi:catechol 2,3-dioxygenase-like lactoylglutathione lyase family enzyme
MEEGSVAFSSTGVEDLAFTVPDLEQATDFFVSSFGAEVISEGGRMADAHRSSMRDYANADVRASVRASRLLRTPFLNLMLAEASYPGQRTLWPMMLDIGGWHLAGYVDDMDAAVDYLGSQDVYVLGPGKKPTTNPPEVGEGSFACHCMTSWGFHFELLTYPNGRAYMADFDGRLWNPAAPDAGATLRSPTAKGIPGFRGFEHLSFAVADLDVVSSFLERVLGCERFYDMGPMSDPHGSEFGAYANVDVRVGVSKVRVFRSPYLNLEVIEPSFPGQNRLWPGLLDVGGWKLVWAVAAIDEALARLRRADVHVLGTKREEEGRAGEGSLWRASCLAPFGFYFDVVHHDPGAPATPASRRAWHPGRPAC